MKRLALLFFVAVLIPCGVLAWFAQRAMKDEQATFHRQHVLLAHEKIGGTGNAVPGIATGTTAGI